MTLKLVGHMIMTTHCEYSIVNSVYFHTTHIHRAYFLAAVN